ncbi:MAG TPA: four helix bundle protein [Thermoanaerobaculia bacterium]|nr:four helix bundle protein [Thermoanaerobaculia bacterium]
MPTIERFEEVKAWKKGRELASSIYRVTASGMVAKDFELRDQLRRAALSVVSNIAEGFERRGDREFRRFLSIAKGSAGEIRAQMYVALDAGLVAEADFQEVLALATETSRVIGGLMRYLDGRDAPTG